MHFLYRSLSYNEQLAHEKTQVSKNRGRDHVLFGAIIPW